MNISNAADELFLESIISFYCFTEQYTVGTFSGWGKAKPLKLMTRSIRYTEAFFMFGKEIELADLHVKNQKCLCVICMAGKKTTLIMLATACTLTVVAILL